jgi:carbon monoxide dehydrogenase subunit G
MVGIIGVAAVVVVGGLLGFAATRPDSFRAARTTTIDAPPEKVFPLIDDFHRWPSWSPWEKLDPGMKRTHSGPERGRGAVYEWDGNKKVGSGRMEIVEAESPSRVKIKLDFLRPFEAHNTTDITLEPAGAGTRVDWAMHGPANFVTKVMGVFVSMDAMVGKDFEEGLANLKREAEG